MRYNEAFRIVVFTLLLVSCKKDYTTNPPTPPPSEPVKKVLLKDITIPNLPSPFYHFEYNSDSMVTKVDFASGFSIYDVIYSGNRIAEMRNNIIVNHDTLRYLYDNAGKVFMITFINQQNVLYRHVSFMYNGDQVKEIDWDHKVDNVGFLIDRRVTFTYHPDGNVKLITNHRPAQDGSPESTTTSLFGQYDDKINVEDFSLIHDTYHDHLFLLQGFHLQRNNPGKETFSAGAGFTAYTVNYTYKYNSDNSPSSKTGDLLFTDGSQAGQRFQTNSFYTYY
jgi:hypothetical protein